MNPDKVYGGYNLHRNSILRNEKNREETVKELRKAAKKFEETKPKTQAEEFAELKAKCQEQARQIADLKEQLAKKDNVIGGQRILLDVKQKPKDIDRTLIHKISRQAAYIARLEAAYLDLKANCVFICNNGGISEKEVVEYKHKIARDALEKLKRGD